MLKLVHALAGASIFWLAASHGASLQVSPTTLSIQPSAQSTSLVLENLGDAPIHAQTRVMSWRQESNSDQLTAAEDVFASPPILSIPPKGKQVVRIVTQGATSGLDFRVLVDELPGAEQSGDGKSVDVYVRYSIPLVVEQAGKTRSPANLTWTWTIKNDVARVRVRNSGERKAQVADMSLVSGPTSVASKTGLVGYVLGGAERVWEFPLKGSTPRHINVRVNGRETTITPATD